MRFLALIVCFFLALGSTQAQNTLTATNTNTAVASVDVRISELMSYMTELFKLDNDQQFSVKKAAKAFVEKVRSTNPANEKQKTALVNEFNADLSKSMDARQKAQFQEAGTVMQPKIDALIDAALGK